MGPDIIPVDDAFFLILRINVENDDIAVDLEQVGKTGRGDVGNGEQGFFLGKIRAVAGQDVADGIAQVPFPVLAVDDDDDFAGLAADIG